MTKLSILALARRLRRDERGIGLVELAFAAPLLMLLGLGMVDVSRIAATKIDMEQAAQRVTDFALAQRPRNNDASYLVREAQAITGITDAELAANPELIQAEIFLECSGTRQADFHATCDVSQSPARFVRVSIATNVDTGFDWRAFANMFGAFGTERITTVDGDSLVRFQ